MKILIIEDNAALAEGVRRGLAESGHVVDVEANGVHGEELVQAGVYDAVILDVMLPGRDGITITSNLRESGVRTPLLMLTARDTVDDIISGLDAGADDYLCKPFSLNELEARLRSIVRREPPMVSNQIAVADLTMDLATRIVKRGRATIKLSARETAFLEYLMRNAGLLVTRSMLEDALWENTRETASNLIEVYIGKLRGKLSPNGEPSLITTVRGAGYRFGSPMR